MITLFSKTLSIFPFFGKFQRHYKPNVIRSILSVSLGNTLEWYEYMLYAYLANVIGQLFFPVNNPIVATTLTFATFAVGFAARPLGGIIFGYISDKYSRKKTLTITLLMMSIPTLCIGLLPTYSTIGVAAPFILVFLRILQGVALGGEFGSSCVYLYESLPLNKRGFFGTIALTSVGSGLILSSCTIFIMEFLVSKEALYSYAWRIPFFISVFGSLLGFYVRRSLLETDDFVLAKKDFALVKNPLLELFKTKKATLLQLFSIFLTTQVSFFVIFVFGKTLMITFLGYSFFKAGIINFLTVVSYTISTVIFDYLSDKVGKRYIILAGVVGIMCAAYPFIYTLKNNFHTVAIALSLLLGIFIGMAEGTLNPLVAESFPTQIRATGVSLCWNMTSILFGGSSPLIATFAINHFGTVDAVAFYLMASCFVSTIALGVSLLGRRSSEN